MMIIAPPCGCAPARFARRQGISRDVHADIFHGRDRAARHHLRAVDRGGAEGLVVGLESADAVGIEQVLDVPHDIEESRDRRAGIAGQEVDASVDFQRALDEQFVSGEDFAAGLGQEARIGSHRWFSVVPCGESISRNWRESDLKMSTEIRRFPVCHPRCSSVPSQRGLRSPVPFHRLQSQETPACTAKRGTLGPAGN